MVLVQHYNSLLKYKFINDKLTGEICDKVMQTDLYIYELRIRYIESVTLIQDIIL